MTATIRIDPESPIPPFEQLRTQLERQIRTQRLPPGSRLPTVRQLANDLGLSANTVMNAYRHLERDGLVTGNRRRGTTVVDQHTTAADRATLISEATHRYLDDLDGLDVTIDEVLDTVRETFDTRADPP